MLVLASGLNLTVAHYVTRTPTPLSFRPDSLSPYGSFFICGIDVARRGLWEARIFFWF